MSSAAPSQRAHPAAPTSIPRQSGYRWVVLSTATFTQVAACYLIQGLGPLAGYLQSALNLTTVEVGLLMSAAQLVPVIGFLIAGALLDNFSERVVVGVGSLIVAGGLLGASLSSGYAGLLFWLVIVGAGYSTANPGGSKSISIWFDQRQRGFAMGVRQAGLPLGGALAAGTLPTIATHWGWPTAFAVGAFVALVGGVVFLLLYRSPHTDLLAGTNVPARTGDGKRFAVLRDKQIRKVVISGVCLITLQFGFLMFFTLDLRDRFGVGLASGAILLFMAQCAGTAGRIALAAWSDRCRTGRYFVVQTSMVALMLGLTVLLLGHTSSWLLLAPLAIWLGFFGFGWGGPWIAYLTESAPRDSVGFSLGLAMAINQICIIAGPPALGLMRDWTGNYMLGWGLLIVLLVAALGLTRTTDGTAVGERSGARRDAG